MSAARYALIGHPVSQSLSPAIHAEFGKQTAQDIRYDLLDALPEKFVETVKAFIVSGGAGMNVTLPFKAEAYKMAARVSPRAAATQVANTLVFEANGTIVADNTDGIGLCRDLSALNLPLENMHLLILGAGGACRGIVPSLLDGRLASLTIANRTVERARAIADEFSQKRITPVRALALDKLDQRRFDAIINATSMSLTDQLPPFPGDLSQLQWCYDLAYARQGQTVFVKRLADKGVRAHDGLGMLVEQAAESFFVWRGVRPSPSTALREVRKFLTAE